MRDVIEWGRRIKKMKTIPLIISAVMILSISITVVMSAPGDQYLNLTVLSTNDIEGYLEPAKVYPEQAYLGGAACISGYFDHVRSEVGVNNTLVLNAGDIWSPGPLISMLFDGASFVDWMNDAEFDAAAIGNHEYDLGQEILMDRIEQAEFPMLAANVYYTKNDERVYQATTLIDRGGIKVGIIGLALPSTLGITVPKFTEGLRFTDGIDEVYELYPQLEDQGATMIIVLAHYGGLKPCTGLAEALDPEHIDLILSGHAEPVLAEANGIPMIACRSHGTEVGRVDFTIDSKTGEVISYEFDRTTVGPDGEFKETDPGIEVKIEYYADQVEAVKSEVVGHTTKPIIRDYWHESPMGDLVTDSMRWFCKQENIPCDFAFQNPGGIRDDIPEAGEITFGDVFKVLPFPNYLVICEMTGEQVRAALEDGMGPQGFMQVSGLSFKVDRSRPRGERIVGKVIDLNTGKPLILDKTYYVAANNFIASGGDLYETLSKTPQIEYPYIKYVDPMVEWMKANSPFTPPDPGEEQRIIEVK
jgi:2',3'-cyclic-nucleotide 2'-phosphodiesterase (5'-nucleotidase family)